MGIRTIVLAMVLISATFMIAPVATANSGGCLGGAASVCARGHQSGNGNADCPQNDTWSSQWTRADVKTPTLVGADVHAEGYRYCSTSSWGNYTDEGISTWGTLCGFWGCAFAEGQWDNQTFSDENGTWSDCAAWAFADVFVWPDPPHAPYEEASDSLAATCPLVAGPPDPGWGHLLP